MGNDDNVYTIDISDTLDTTVNIDGLTVGGVTTDYSTGSYTMAAPSSIDTSFTVPSFSINYDNHNDFDSGINIQEGDLKINEGGDIKIGNRSLKTFMDTMEKRLAILQPDPTKLEKFEALRKAYEHYKTMESLCHDDANDDEAVN